MEYIARGDFQRMTDLSRAFHVEIARAGKNSYLSDYYEKLLDEGQRLLHLHFDYLIGNASGTGQGRDHDKLVAAIADAEEHAAHEHTMLFQRRFLNYLQQNLTAPTRAY